MERLHAVRPHQYQTAGKQRIHDIDVAPREVVGKRTRTQDLQFEAAGAAPATTAQQPATSPNHVSREFTLEVKQGSLTGALVATLELGKTGAAATDVGPAVFKAFEQSATTRLNGFTSKLQAALVNIEADFEVLDGLNVAIEANGASFGVSEEGAEIELASISVKVVGDITEGLNLPKGMTVSVDGRLTLSLDAALAARLGARLAALRATHRRMVQLGSDLDRAAGALEREATAHKELVARRSALSSNRGYLEVDAELRNIEKEIAVRQRNINDGVKQVESLTTQLDDASKQATSQFGKLRGKLTSGVGRVMRTRAVQSVTKVLLKALPVVNVLSTTFEVVGALESIKNLLAGAESDPNGTDPSGSGMGGMSSEPIWEKAKRLVTQPAQVPESEGSGSYKNAKEPVTSTQGARQRGLQDPLSIAEHPPESILLSWFTLRGNEVVETGARDALDSHECWIQSRRQDAAVSQRSVVAAALVVEPRDHIRGRRSRHRSEAPTHV